MAKQYAAFPLELICFPGETQNLHIFEARYRTLVRDCIEHDISFIMVPFVDGKTFHLGTEMILEKVQKEYDDGKFDITVRATGLVKISGLRQNMDDKPYPGVKATPLSWNLETDYKKCEKLNMLIHELYDELSIDNAKIPSPDQMTCAKVVHKLGLSKSQELELLTLANEIERIDFLIDHLEHFIPTIKRAESLKLMAALNGHYKNINPKHLY